MTDHSNCRNCYFVCVFLELPAVLMRNTLLKYLIKLRVFPNTLFYTVVPFVDASQMLLVTMRAAYICLFSGF